jgi:uncharacterized protein (DUF983 family)
VDLRASVARAIWRGARLRCPRCGARTLFSGYLKLSANCATCGADFSRSGTADVAPYVTILLIGLTCMPLIVSLALTSGAEADMLLLPALISAGALALLLLPRVKGVLAALLWRAGREM